MNFISHSFSGWSELWRALYFCDENPFHSYFYRQHWGRRPYIAMPLTILLIYLVLTILHYQIGSVVIDEIALVKRYGGKIVNTGIIYLNYIFSVPPWIALIVLLKIRNFKIKSNYQEHLAVVPDSSHWLRRSFLIQLLIPGLISAFILMIFGNLWILIYYYFYGVAADGNWTLEQYYFFWFIDVQLYFDGVKYLVLIPAAITRNMTYLMYWLCLYLISMDIFMRRSKLGMKILQLIIFLILLYILKNALRFCFFPAIYLEFSDVKFPKPDLIIFYSMWVIKGALFILTSIILSGLIIDRMNNSLSVICLHH